MKIVKKEEREVWSTETAKGYEYPFNTKILTAQWRKLKEDLNYYK